MKTILLLPVAVVASITCVGTTAPRGSDDASNSRTYATDTHFSSYGIAAESVGAGPLQYTSPPRASNPPPLAEAAMKDRLVVDVDKSVVRWKGTKFWGMGKHEGVVRLAEGSVILREGAILAGKFVLDMTTIEVTDIPASDPIPRRRLREHLKDEHFFFVERYPTAVFEISSARRGEGDIHSITGRLTMRGKTRGISFDADIPVMNADALRATASFSINRHEWGVAYRGSRLTNDLVDDLIELKLMLVADKPDPS